MAVNLRKEAQGRECQISIYNVCNRNPETTVLAHPNNKLLFGGGMGIKPHDMFGAWSCNACHDAVDGRTVAYHNGIDYTRKELQLLFDEGVFRTQKILLDEGKIGVI